MTPTISLQRGAGERDSAVCLFGSARAPSMREMPNLATRWDTSRSGKVFSKAVGQKTAKTT